MEYNFIGRMLALAGCASNISKETSVITGAVQQCQCTEDVCMYYASKNSKMQRDQTMKVWHSLN